MRRATVAVAPAGLDDNPYLPELLHALSAHGVVVEGRRRVGVRWAVTVGRRMQAINLHWLEYLVQTRHGSGLRGAASVTLRATDYLTSLLLLRMSGVRIVWTVHNLRPHRQRYPVVDTALACGTLLLSTSVIVHSEHAARQLRRRHPRTARDISVVPHPGYADAYGDRAAISREDARQRLGLHPDALVVLAFGRVRRDKGVTAVIRAFRAADVPDARLLVVGAPADGTIAAEVRAAAEGDDRIDVRLDFVDEESVGLLHAAADLAPFYYDDLFSSGALALAQTWGLRIVTRAAGSDGTAEMAAALADHEGQPGHPVELSSWEDMALAVIERFER